jgi:hypothetical protein
MTLHLPTTVDAIRAEMDGQPFQGDPMALSHLMEFDSPITVHEDGTVTDAARDVYAPTLYDDGLDSSEWELMDGYSGQYGYGGPIMHQSEFIGGRMARDILAEPGTYVAIVANYSPTCLTCEGDVIQGDGPDYVWHHLGDTAPDYFDAERDSDHAPDVNEDTSEGWAVARLV